MPLATLPSIRSAEATASLYLLVSALPVPTSPDGWAVDLVATRSLAVSLGVSRDLLGLLDAILARHNPLDLRLPRMRLSAGPRRQRAAIRSWLIREGLFH